MAPASTLDDTPVAPEPRLGVRFWLGFLLPALLGSLALGALAAWLDTEGRALQAGSVAWLVGWPLMALWLMLGGAGAWRAATAAAARGAARWAVWGAKAAIVALAAGWAVAAALSFAPQLSPRIAAAAGTDAEGGVQATLSADGRRLRLSGHLGQGDAARVLAVMQTAPRLALLEIDSLYARLHEARRLASAVQAQQLQVRVLGECGKACGLLFMAGARRELMPGAQLRLYPPQVGTLNPLWRQLSRRHVMQVHADAGWPLPLAGRIAAMSPAVPWRPDAAELAAAGLVGVPGWPLDVLLPVGQGLPVGDYAEALAANPVWQLLERRFPGLAARAAEQMHRRAGAAAAAATQPAAAPALADALQVAAQAEVQALLPALMARADPFLREKFVALLSEQLQAVQPGGASACRQLLAGDAAVRRALPTPLRQREAAWIVEAASEPDAAAAAAAAPRRRSELEMEVLRRSLGATAVAQLAGLWGPASAAAPQRLCERALELVSAVLALPTAERRSAVRMIVLD